MKKRLVLLSSCLVLVLAWQGYAENRKQTAKEQIASLRNALPKLVNVEPEKFDNTGITVVGAAKKFMGVKCVWADAKKKNCTIFIGEESAPDLSDEELLAVFCQLVGHATLDAQEKPDEDAGKMTDREMLEQLKRQSEELLRRFKKQDADADHFAVELLDRYNGHPEALLSVFAKWKDDIYPYEERKAAVEAFIKQLHPDRRIPSGT